MSRRKKLSKWERDAKRKREANGQALKEATRALTVLVPFVPEYGQQRQVVMRAHNVIAGLFARFKLLK